MSPTTGDEHDELTEEEEEGSRRRRILASLALASVALFTAYLLLKSGSSYQVTASFQNASQLVKGSQVVVGGVPAGSVREIALGAHGEALVTLALDGDYAPLRRGTTAQIRSYSLSGIANRQVELRLPPPSEAGPEIPSGGTLSQSETTSEVDLDQLFNTLNAKTIKNFKHLIEGFQISYEGVGKQANAGYHYLNPFLSSSRRLFGELSADSHAFESLIVDTSHLSGALAARAPEISLLIDNVDRMMAAIGGRSAALSEAIARLPAFMRQSNTTFVNLRATLDDLDPLVDASKPVAARLGPFFSSFRRAAHDAVPTIADLNRLISRPGAENDLVELTRDQLPLARAGVGSGSPQCGSGPSAYAAAADRDFTQGALGESACSLQNGLGALAFFRPYTPELVGWFNDFGTSGINDANGGIGRISTTFNTFSASAPGTPGSPIAQLAALPGATGNDRRCPGSNERDPGDHSTPFTDNGTLACDPSQVPLGP